MCIQIQSKVLTLNEGLAMAPLLIPEQPAVARLERNRVFLTQRKPDRYGQQGFSQSSYAAHARTCRGRQILTPPS
jgi:hypothetical protein